MKFLFVSIVMLLPGVVLAASPSTSCPAGFVAVEEEAMSLSTNLCPSSHTSTGVTYSCLQSDIYLVNGSCIMYAEGGPWTDNTGTYELVGPCMLQ